MSFKVDPGALSEFAQLLSAYSLDADTVRSYLRDETDMSFHSEGLLNKIAFGHQAIVKGMADRLHEMEKVGGTSSSNMEITASQYDVSDESAQAKLEKADKSYDPPKPYDDRKGEPDKATFDYEDVEGQLKLDKKPTDLEPKASDIEEWARDSFDQMSMMSGIRAGLEFICKVDVVDWFRQWWFGDWKAWARCALVFDACGDAVNVMAENLWRAIPALDDAWDGNAAGQAVTYFEKLRDATFTEVDAFKAVYDLYKVMLEAIHVISQVMNDVINTVLEALIMILMAPVKGGAMLAKVASAPEMVLKVWEGFGNMQTLVTAAMDIVAMIETVEDASDLEEIPPCELKGLNGKGEDAAYHHPGEDDWFKD